jgi:glycosyltransferase involved in cell wall biosynthesis
MADVGILALVSDDWDDAPQRRHQILARMRTYAPVAWISPAHQWAEWLRRWARGRSSQERLASPDSRMFVLAAADGTPTVYHPRSVRRALYRRRVLRGARWLEQQGCRSIELQIWNPEFVGALDWVRHSTSSYHVDDEYSWSTVDGEMPAAERRLIERVDRVYVTSPKLLETKGGINPRTIFSPNGVDYAAFFRPTPEPADLASIPHPRVGYVGVLKEQLDWPLLSTLAARHAAWSFVLIGPVRAVHLSIREPLAALRALPNVHLLGERSAETLPAYLQGIDVAILPYRRNAYTDCINPLKLYEALAAGTPVVAARLRTLEDFSSVIALADTVDEWSSGIAAAISATSVAPKTERQALAREYDWDDIVAPLIKDLSLGPTFEGGLGRQASQQDR